MLSTWAQTFRLIQRLVFHLLWSWGYCSAVTPDGWRWIVDAHREGRRYIVHSDELLTAFLHLEATLL